MDVPKRNGGFTPIVITPPAPWELPNFHELWEYRGLFFFLVRRDILVRFQQTVAGFLWVVLQPLIQMLIFYVIFGLFVKIPTNGIPYPLFFLSGFVVWQFFTQVVNNSALSLVGNISVIIKSYFPRLALPLSSVASALVDLLVSFVVLMVFLLANGHYPITWRYLLLPVLLLVSVVFASGVGLLFGALMVVFRDMKNLINFVMMIWMYITPIMYPLSIVPERYQVFFFLNPMTSLVDAYRWVFLGPSGLPHYKYLTVSFLVAILIWLAGAIAFRAMENKIADVL
jgi:homopolymeric O-antigen transport system permease protein